MAQKQLNYFATETVVMEYYYTYTEELFLDEVNASRIEGLTWDELCDIMSGREPDREVLIYNTYRKEKELYSVRDYFSEIFRDYSYDNREIMDSYDWEEEITIGDAQ